MTPAGFARLKTDEGYSLRLYKDVRGNTSIGFGRNLSAEGIRADEAALMLTNDLQAWETTLSKFVWFIDLDQIRRDVIVNMAHNLGIAGLLGFHQMIAAIEKRDYNAAADAILDSDAARMLTTRYARLTSAMRSGAWA